MKKQIFNLKSLAGLALTLISLFGFRYELSAQTLNADGTPHTVEATNEAKLYQGAPQDFTIPTNVSFNSILFTLKGGDGGYAKAGNNCKSNGGEGATTTVGFKIGSATDELKPGGIIRFVVGKRGDDKEYGGSNDAASCGGGGTAILYRPSNTADWTILAVAGGGGGAHQGNVLGGCVDSQKGQGGRSTEYGGNGEGKNGANGGKDGNGGDGGASFAGAGGGGAYSDGEGESSEYIGGRKGFPGGGEGSLYQNDEPSGTGGWGFGGGGTSGLDGGGGGGGYSGGGGGDNANNGGGGGSYVNTVYAYSYTKTAGRTGYGNSQNGQVSYYFLNTGSRPQLFTQIKFAYNTGKCIDDYGSNTSNGTNIQTYNCHSADNQWWRFDPTDRTIRSKLSTDKCLSLKDDTGNNGTNIHLWDCKVNDNQRFVYNGLYKTFHSARNANKCLDAVGGSSTTSNVNLQLWSCGYTNNNQKWIIDGATTASNVSNMKYIVPVQAPGFAMLSKTGSESGSNIMLWTKDNISTNEQWYFDGLAIKMRNHQNLCIDLKSSSTSNGTNIQLYNCNDTNAQKWLYDGMTQTIRSVINQDKCMQIMKNTDGVYGKQSNVEIHDCNGSDVQQFLIQE